MRLNEKFYIFFVHFTIQPRKILFTSFGMGVYLFDGCSIFTFIVNRSFMNRNWTASSGALVNNNKL